MADFKFTEIGKLGNSISVQKMEGAGNVYFRVRIAGQYDNTKRIIREI